MKKVFYTQSLFLFWLYWHFNYVPRRIIIGWKNLFLFNFKFFSILFLFKTLFSYWHKYRWSYGRGIDLPRYVNTFFSNLISRFLGALVRVFLIIFGIFSGIFVGITGLLVLLLWITLPFFSLFGVITGIKLIFYG